MDFERLEDLVDLLAVEGLFHEAQDVAGARVGLLVLHAVPALDDRFARCAQPHDEPTFGHFGHGGDAHGQQARTPREDRRDRDAEIQTRFPDRGQRERCETVSAVDFSRPKVGVAKIGDSVEPLLVVPKRDAVEGIVMP